MKKLHLLLLITIAFTSAYAQKLPKIQATSVRAPANIKIDGKLTEWNDKFQAYNPGQHIYYTVSNDDSNLYLTVRMDDIPGSYKVLKGGITFIVLPLSKKENDIAITFPFTRDPSMYEVEHGPENPITTYKKLMGNPVKNKKKMDSLVTFVNRKFGKDHKYIHVTGLPGMNDPLLPIYNTQEILVAANFDKSMDYIYELAIPLKYVQTALSNAKSLKYKVVLNGNPFEVKKRADSLRALNRPMVQFIEPASIYLWNDTDFSGEYTLAK